MIQSNTKPKECENENYSVDMSSESLIPYYRPEVSNKGRQIAQESLD